MVAILSLLIHRCCPKHGAFMLMEASSGNGLGDL